MEHLMQNNTATLVKKIVNQNQSGQFSYVANPNVLWPDFLMGQAASPLRVILVDADPAVQCSVAEADQTHKSVAPQRRDGGDLCKKGLPQVERPHPHAGGDECEVQMLLN